MHFDSWRTETLSKLREVVSKADDQAIVDARHKRSEALAAKSREVAAEGEDLLLDLGGPASDSSDKKKVETAQGGTVGSLSSFQNLYHPIPTRLTTVPTDDRKEVLSATLLVLLSTGNYSAYSRTLMCYLASALEIPPRFLDTEEAQIATTMVESAKKADEEKKKQGDMSDVDTVAETRRQEGQASRFWKVGLASVAGAAIIGVTGGLAAPVIAGAVGGLMGTVGLGGLASFLGIFWMNGALVGTLFGAFGAKMTGEMIDNYAKEVEDFKFLPLADEWGKEWKNRGSRRPGGRSGDAGEDDSEAAARRLRVTIGINGWLTTESDVTKPWRALGDESEVFALRYEMESLLALGAGLGTLINSYAWSAIRVEILRRTVLATLWSALWPIHLVSMASKLDNPFSLARNRSEKAGRVLADALIHRVQGERPVTLVGYSLGARVIYSCLRALAEKRAFGLVDTVVLIGAPVPSNPGHWQMMRSVVAGRLFNVYSENDLILAFLYRATSAQLGIAGLEAITCSAGAGGGEMGSSNGEAKVGDEGIVNLDLSAEVQGHMRYPELIARILTRCGFPNVKGGKDDIEKEKAPEDDNDSIRLRDRDFAESGNLIDYGEPGVPSSEAKPLELPKHTISGLESDVIDPGIKNEPGMKGDTSVGEAKLLGVDKNAKSSTWSADSRGSYLLESGRSPPPGQVPSPLPTPLSTAAGHGRGDDSDDELGHWVQMVDHENNDDMKILEPLAIDDGQAC